MCGFSYALIGTTAGAGIVWWSFHRGARAAIATITFYATIGDRDEGVTFHQSMRTCRRRRGSAAGRISQACRGVMRTSRGRQSRRPEADRLSLPTPHRQRGSGGGTRKSRGCLSPASWPPCLYLPMLKGVAGGRPRPSFFCSGFFSLLVQYRKKPLIGRWSPIRAEHGKGTQPETPSWSSSAHIVWKHKAARGSPLQRARRRRLPGT